MLDALHMAAAATMLCELEGVRAPGRDWTAVCVWCLLAADPTETAPARRVGGDCLRCHAIGAALLPEVA